MQSAETTTPRPDFQGRVIYLVLGVILLGLFYPISEAGPGGALGFNVIYSTVYAAGAYVLAGKGRGLWWMLALSVANLLIGSVSFMTDAFFFDMLWISLVIVFQMGIALVLLRFIFQTEHVNRDVLFAGVTAYLLIGYSFAPVYNLMEAFAPGSFAIAAGAPPSWQRFLYFSMATITTAGYGDITPVSPWAQAIVGMEAAIGVLYIAILMGRLVGLYAHERSGLL